MTDLSLNDTQPIEPEPDPKAAEAARIAGALTGVRHIPELQKYIQKHSDQIDALEDAYHGVVAELGGALTVEVLTERGIDPAQAAELVAEFNARG